MSLQLQLAARGVLGDTMKGVGFTAAKPDDLGYLPLGFELPALVFLRAPPTRPRFTAPWPAAWSSPVPMASPTA